MDRDDSPPACESAAPARLDSSTCPRCGGGFACGAKAPGPCACTTLVLDPALLGDLRLRYQGCLCLTCLRELAQAAHGAAI